MYHIIDIKTGFTVAKCATRNGASRSADRRDMEYGAVRYIVKFISMVA